ncbi:Uma2 family endonuclease [Streptomyces sp. NPDC001851]|uniref:Uma2 family endonuclease n=1 Tax=Streptomyces sp. NPDC001851 TaxID=3154529 RepID=UPI00332ABA26
MADRRLIKFLEEFEAPQGIRVELLREEIVMTTSPDLVHNMIVEDVSDQIPRRRWSRLQTQYVDMLDGGGVLLPDLVVIERGAVPDRGTRVPSEAVTASVEVVSKTSVHCDYRVKPSVYAQARVPAYLVIDPVMAQCGLFT